MGGGDAGGKAVQFLGHACARLWGQCADGAQQNCAFGNDIVGGARRYFGDGDNGRIEHRNLARHHCLDGRDDFARDGDGVDGVMRHGGVAASALDGYGQHIGRCQ